MLCIVLLTTLDMPIMLSELAEPLRLYANGLRHFPGLSWRETPVITAVNFDEAIHEDVDRLTSVIH
jgi:hypothetical protein